MRAPVRDITSLKWELNRSGLARLQPDFLEPAKSFNGCRGLVRDLRKAQVELCNGVTGNVASVGNRRGDFVDSLPKLRVTSRNGWFFCWESGDAVNGLAKGGIGDAECGVRQAWKYLISNVSW